MTSLLLTEHAVGCIRRGTGDGDACSARPPANAVLLGAFDGTVEQPSRHGVAVVIGSTLILRARALAFLLDEETAAHHGVASGERAILPIAHFASGGGVHDRPGSSDSWGSSSARRSARPPWSACAGAAMSMVWGA